MLENADSSPVRENWWGVAWEERREKGKGSKSHKGNEGTLQRCTASHSNPGEGVLGEYRCSNLPTCVLHIMSYYVLNLNNYMKKAIQTLFKLLGTCCKIQTATEIMEILNNISSELLTDLAGALGFILLWCFIIYIHKLLCFISTYNTFYLC